MLLWGVKGGINRGCYKRVYLELQSRLSLNGTVQMCPLC